jgi:hypothetical protein
LSEESKEQRLEKIMDTSYARAKIYAMSQKQDVSYDIAESMFRSTLKQMLEDKNTDWSEFKVIEDE